MITEGFVFFGRSDPVKKKQSTQLNSEKKDTIFPVATSEQGAYVF